MFLRSSLVPQYYYVRTSYNSFEGTVIPDRNVLQSTALSTCPPSIQVALVVSSWMGLLPNICLSACLLDQQSMHIHATNPFVTPFPPSPAIKKAVSEKEQ